MLPIEIKVLNKDKMNSLKLKQEQVIKNIQNIVKISGFNVMSKARDKCPVVTANLRDSITVEFLMSAPNFGAKIYTNVVYASEQEYNTTYNHNHPQQKNSKATWGFLRKSLQEVQPEFKEAIREAFA
jgi:hypothetical protein